MAHTLFLFLSKCVIDCGEVLWNEKKCVSLQSISRQCTTTSR